MKKEKKVDRPFAMRGKRGMRFSVKNKKWLIKTQRKRKRKYYPTGSGNGV